MTGPKKELNYLYCVAESLNMVYHIFEQDGEKTQKWFYTRNPLLGDVSPIDMIRNGNAPKLLEFIEQAHADNAYEKISLPEE